MEFGLSQDQKMMQESVERTLARLAPLDRTRKAAETNAIARDVKETVRKLKAAQFVANNPGQVCPAKWNEGAKTITPSLDLVGKI